jgi:hypothetical protein
MKIFPRGICLTVKHGLAYYRVRMSRGGISFWGGDFREMSEAIDCLLDLRKSLGPPGKPGRKLGLRTHTNKSARIARSSADFQDAG